MTDSLHFVFVELDRFDKKWEDIDNDKERFYFCIRHMHELESLPDGFAEGREKGLAEGLEKGREEEKLSTARKMKADGIDVEAICKYTGLSIEEVKNL